MYPALSSQTMRSSHKIIAKKMRLLSSTILYITTLTLLWIEFSQIGLADGAKAIYIFGDSFVDVGNGGNMSGTPYGMTWPGTPGGRASDGRNQADYFAELFGLPSPAPYWQVKNHSRLRSSAQGVNFGRGGGAVTYAYGHTSLDEQVDQLEELVAAEGSDHLRHSVALVSIGVNDYGARNLDRPFKESAESLELEAMVRSVVDGIALNVMRLYDLGLFNIIVSNLFLLPCSPMVTVESNYTECSGNNTLLNETAFHNELLQRRMGALNRDLLGAHVIIVDQSKAFAYLFQHGAEFGFRDTLRPCCTGVDDGHYCGDVDCDGYPLFNVCNDARKAVIFDNIHRTQKAWEVVIGLYAAVPGFTQEGPALREWIQRYKV